MKNIKIIALLTVLLSHGVWAQEKKESSDYVPFDSDFSKVILDKNVENRYKVSFMLARNISLGTGVGAFRYSGGYDRKIGKKGYYLGGLYAVNFSNIKTNEIITFGNSSIVRRGTLVQELQNHFMGISFGSRIQFDPKLHLWFTTAVGYSSFRNDLTFRRVQRATLIGGTVGSVSELGIDILFYKKVAFGIELLYQSGIIRKYTQMIEGREIKVTLREEERISLSFIGVGIGLRYYL